MITLKDNYVRFLNRNYCVTAHLAERLDELRGLTFTPNFQLVLGNTIDQLEQYLDITNQNFELLKNVFSIPEQDSLVHFLEEVFATVQNYEGGFSTLFLLDYICVTEFLLKESADFAELLLKQLPELQINDQSFDICLTLKPLKALIKKISVPA